MSEKLVTVYELLKRRDGSPSGIGNSHECSVDEAIYLIQQFEATSVVSPIGVVPPEWLEESE